MFYLKMYKDGFVARLVNDTSYLLWNFVQRIPNCSIASFYVAKFANKTCSIFYKTCKYFILIKKCATKKLILKLGNCHLIVR